MTTYVIGWPITWPQEAQGWKEGTGTHLEAVNFRMKSQFSFSSAFQRLAPAEERGPILDTIVWTGLMLQSMHPKRAEKLSYPWPYHFARMGRAQRRNLFIDFTTLLERPSAVHVFLHTRQLSLWKGLAFVRLTVSWFIAWASHSTRNICMSRATQSNESNTSFENILRLLVLRNADEFKRALSRVHYIRTDKELSYED